MTDGLNVASPLQQATSGLRDPRTWRAAGYIAVGLVATGGLFVVAVVFLAVSLALCLVGIGIPVTVGTLTLLTKLAGVERRRTGWVGVPVSVRAVAPGTFMTRLRDRGRWRHAVFALTAWLPTLVAFVALVVVWGVPVYLLSVPLWGWAVVALSWPAIIGMAAAGAGLLCGAPWATQVIGRLLVRFTAATIGPDRLAIMEQQVSDLSRNRSEILAAIAGERRRIERNLHDGVQQRLVALGIDLGLAEAKLGSDPESARALLADAKEKTRASIGELRVIGRGLHPAILGDRGLDAALSALVSNSSVPVELRCNLAVNPPAKVQEAAYFLVSEALTNVMKHSQAHTAFVEVTSDAGELALSIHDDGHGGATYSGTGLAGVSARVRGLDGTFNLSSPSGGPTTVSAKLPYPRRTPEPGTR